MPPSELTELRERVQAAEDGVRYWESMVAEAEAAAGAPAGLFSRLLGTSEQRAAEARAQVETARGRLEHARRAARDAHAELEQAEVRHQAAEEAELARLAALEERAERIRDDDAHPRAAALRQLEARMVEVRSELGLVKAATEAGQRLLAAVNQAESVARSAANASERDLTGPAPFAELGKHAAVDELRRLLATLPGRVRDYQGAAGPSAWLSSWATCPMPRPFPLAGTSRSEVRCSPTCASTSTSRGCSRACGPRGRMFDGRCTPSRSSFGPSRESWTA